MPATCCARQYSLLDWPRWLQNYVARGCAAAGFRWWLGMQALHQACNFVLRRCRRISADSFHTGTDRAFPFQFATFQEWRPSRADPSFWQPLQSRLKRPESHLFVFFRHFWFIGPLIKFASSWLKTVHHVINFRHDIVVTVQMCDAESSQFLLREIHLGGQGAFQGWVRHWLTYRRLFDTNASPFPTK